MDESNWPTVIKNKKLVVVEGKEDVGFFVGLLDQIGINDFFVWGIGGKDVFNNDLPLLAKVQGFSDITHLVVVRDRNGDDAFDSVINILTRKMGFSEIEGCMLEDLCLKIVEDHPVMECVNEFASCVSKLESTPKNLSKTKVQVFLASQPEVANTIGLGAQKGYWDFDSPCLTELKQFLENLR